MSTTPETDAAIVTVERAIVHLEDDLWVTYEEHSGELFSIHMGPEPEFSQDEGLIQINLTTLPINVVKSIDTNKE